MLPFLSRLRKALRRGFHPFSFLRCSLSIRSIACRFTGRTDGALENQVGSLGLFRAARGLVDLGGLGAVGADMDTVVEIAWEMTSVYAFSSPHCTLIVQRAKYIITSENR